MKIQLKRSNVLTGGFAKEPTAQQLEYGELAVNYNTDDPAIFLKDSNNNVIRISGIGNIADDGQVELPASNTPPLNPQPGNLWYNSEDGRLYIYYKDPDTEQWVDASPDSWDPSSYPDVSDDDAQAGTLDDRYLMLNTANDPLTGGLIVADGNVGIGTSAPTEALDVIGNIQSDGEIKALKHRSTGTVTSSGGGTFGFNSQITLDVTGGTNSNNVYPSSYKSAPINETSSLSNFSHYLAQQVTNQSGGSITNQRVFDCSINLTDTATNTFGFVSRLNEGSNTNYNFYAIGTAPNYFAGKVGIGTTTPLSQLHLSSATGIASPIPTELTIGTSSNGSGWSVTDPWGKISFYSADASDSGPKVHASINTIASISNGGSSDLTFNVNGSEHLRIKNNGNVGIGTDAPEAPLHVRSDSGSISWFSSTSTRSTIRFSTSEAGNLYIGSEGENNFVVRNKPGSGNVSEKFRITGNGKVGIGTTEPNDKLEVNGNIRFTQAGQGINFNDYGIGDNIDNNLLDDYEEGTFTPSFKGGTTAGSTVTYNQQSGKYTKIGDVVHVALYIKLTSKGDIGGTVFIDGLPFPIPSASKQFFKASLCIGAPLDWNTVPTGCITQNNTTTAKLNNYADGGGEVGDAALQSKSAIYVSGTYKTNS